ncbi:transcriptional regulator domain-containing protein [Paenirhodobacter populi]|uniref:transcriptional regulator domain-containing protein n=1 Tax=Paenirhodobacter populi TaxID=2306993 RepID=UPI00374329A7
MRPDTSHWRDHSNYDIFDTLPVEGLAWECLRRHEPYQTLYQSLVVAKSETLPLPLVIQNRWGLRFRGPSRPLRSCPEHFLVSRHRPGGPDPHAASRHASKGNISLPNRTRRQAR